jgi:drug/metabolite transporter (DMT)-like permease
VNNGLCAILSGVLAAAVWRWPSPEQWLLLISIGLTTVVGQIAFLRAMTIGEASFVAPYLYTTLIFSALYGYLFFSEVPGLVSYLGAGLIISSGLYLCTWGNAKASKRQRLTSSTGLVSEKHVAARQTADD